MHGRVDLVGHGGIGAKLLKSNLKSFTFEVKYPVQRFLKEIEGLFNIKKTFINKRTPIRFFCWYKTFKNPLKYV